jgi:hypothetical protein
MSEQLFTGGLWAVLPGRSATAGKLGGLCTACKTCKAIILLGLAVSR